MPCLLAPSQVAPAVEPSYELAELFDLACDLFCIAGLDGYLKVVNASFERVLGFSREELLSRPFMWFFHPEDVERAGELLSESAIGHDLVGFESRLVCADGSVRHLEWSTRTVPELGVVYGIGRDVTERATLAEEQAALRRVATLVARGSPPGVVLSAVVEEMGRVVGLESTALLRYEDGAATPVASWGRRPLPLGTPFPLEEGETGTTIDDILSAVSVRSAVAAPIIVDGRPWGAMIALAEEQPSEHAAARMIEFTELLAAAIASIDARCALIRSRARIVATADAERRRVVRDLHDGAQQRLVHAIMTLRLAQEALDDAPADADSLISAALGHMHHATRELRDLAHGILPAALTTGGLRPVVEDLAARMSAPVEVDVCGDRLPAIVEATAYFVISEALTNVAKHARAANVAVISKVANETLAIEVRDDGVGGAHLDGSGLQGLVDRLVTLDGLLWIDSPAHGGTVISATIPIPRPATDPDARSRGEA